MTLALEIGAVVLALLFLLRVLNLIVLMRWYRAPRAPGSTVLVDERRVYHTLKGNGSPTVVVEAAMGAVTPEWWRIQEELAATTRVLTYDRAGCGWSAPSDDLRLSENVASELKRLLDTLEIVDPVVLVGHSLGGLYVNHFARLYPERVCGIVFIDPVSPDNDRFRRELTPLVFGHSGVDKTRGLKALAVFNGFGFTRLMKRWVMQSYASDTQDPLPGETLKVLWHHMLMPHTPKTALAEYLMIQGRGARADLTSPEGFPDVPLRVITHASERVIEQIVRYGKLTREEAASVERIWQDLIRAHAGFAPRSALIVAGRSGHNVHLDEPQIIVKTVLEVVNEVRRPQKAGPRNPTAI